MLRIHYQSTVSSETIATYKKGVLMSFIQTVRSRAIVALRRVLRAIYALRLSKYPELKELLAAYSSSESAAVDLADAIAIYEIILSRRPRYLLELGPGTSTVIITLAISQVRKSDPNYKPVFVAIEENEQWLSYHEKHFSPELRGLVEMIHRPSVGKMLGDRKVACYSEIPIHPYEFIHVDGPDFLKHGATVSSDLIDLEPHLSKSCYVIFDGRQDSARFAAQHLPSFMSNRNPYSLNHELSRA